MINIYDAKEIANKTADTFRTLCAHRSASVSGGNIESVKNLVHDMLADQIDNSQILDRQLNTQTGVVESIDSEEQV